MAEEQVVIQVLRSQQGARSLEELLQAHQRQVLRVQVVQVPQGLEEQPVSPVLFP